MSRLGYARRLQGVRGRGNSHFWDQGSDFATLENGLFTGHVQIHAQAVFHWKRESDLLQRMGCLGKITAFLGLLLCVACAGPLPDGKSRIAVLGDSMMAWNGAVGKSAPHHLGDLLQEPVANFAMTGARMSHPLSLPVSAGYDIRRQPRKGPWEVVIVNGGANDFFFECGCIACDPVLDRLISADGMKGEIPQFLSGVRKQGVPVIYVGYHRSRGLAGPAKSCKDELDTLDARVELLSKKLPGLSFVSLQTVFPEGDPTYYTFDRLHPSPKGSAAIAERLEPEVRRVLGLAKRH